MTDAHAIASSKDVQGRSLVTRESLAASLAGAGIVPGDAVLAHVGLSRLGYVCGAAETVINALTDAVGPLGTIMMPTFTGEISDPADWRHPPAPPDWVEPIRREMPLYNAAITPTRQMGVVPELFRHLPGTRRSPHPHSSFAARGPAAATLVDRHPLDFRFGPDSPLGALAALDGKVLLLGAGPERASLVYLAQQLSGIGPDTVKRIPMPDGGGRRWVDCRDIAVQNSLVPAAVQHLVAAGIGQGRRIGDADCVLFPARAALAALLAWRWRDSGLDVRACRRPVPLPTDWSAWLKDRPNLDHHEPERR